MQIAQETFSVVEDIVNFISLLVFKDEQEADKQETQESAAAAATYLSAVLKTDGNTEAQRAVIIKTYVEKNKYYKWLWRKYGVPYYTSRLAKDLDIVYQPTAVFTSKPLLQNYRSLYKECLTYFYFTSYSKALEGQDNYRNLALYIINLMAFIKMIHVQLETPYDIDLMNENQLDKFMMNFGISYFRRFPIYYKQNLARRLNTLISEKGTDRVITDIVNVFGFDNVELHRYHLVRDVTDPKNKFNSIITKPKFISHNIALPSLAVAIKTNQYKVWNYNSVVDDDPTWQADPNEVASYNFDHIQTKYFSVESNFELFKSAMDTTYLLNVIKEVRRDYSARDKMTIYLTNISNLPIKIEDLILTLQVLSLMYHGVQDVIQYDLDNIGDIYMYNIHDSLVETKKSFNTDDASVRETVMLTDMDSVNSFGFTDTNALHKQGKKVRSYYEDLLESTTKYPKFKALVDLYKFKFIQKYNNSVFKPYATYTDYIRANNKDLGTYLQAITDIVSDTDRKDEIERQIVYLTDAVKNALGDNTLVFDNDATDIMASYIREVVDVFKAYTVMLKDMKVSILVKDKTVYKLIDDYYFHAHMEWTDRIPDLSDAINPMHGKMDAYRKKGFMWRDYVRVNDSFTINHVDYS